MLHRQLDGPISWPSNNSGITATIGTPQHTRFLRFYIQLIKQSGTNPTSTILLQSYGVIDANFNFYTGSAVANSQYVKIEIEFPPEVMTLNVTLDGTNPVYDVKYWVETFTEIP